MKTLPCNVNNIRMFCFDIFELSCSLSWLALNVDVEGLTPGCSAYTKPWPLLLQRKNVTQNHSKKSMMR